MQGAAGRHHHVALRRRAPWCRGHHTRLGVRACAAGRRGQCVAARRTPPAVQPCGVLRDAVGTGSAMTGPGRAGMPVHTTGHGVQRSAPILARVANGLAAQQKIVSCSRARVVWQACLARVHRTQGAALVCPPPRMLRSVAVLPHPSALRGYMWQGWLRCRGAAAPCGAPAPPAADRGAQ